MISDVWLSANSWYMFTVTAILCVLIYLYLLYETRKVGTSLVLVFNPFTISICILISVIPFIILGVALTFVTLWYGGNKTIIYLNNKEKDK